MNKLTVVEETAVSRVERVLGFVGEARTSIAGAVSDIEKALNVATYMGGNSELLRQLHITRTQLQTADLWAANAASQVPAATEGE
jgi:hypothetical protein